MSSLIPPEALEGLMRKVFLDQTVAPGLFWDAILKADLFVPLSREGRPPGSESVITDEKQDLPILLGVDEKGKHVIWIFSSPEAMIDYTEQDLPYLKMSAPSLFESLRKSERDVVFIGPEGVTLRLHPDLIASLADGRVPEPPANEEVREIPKDAQVYVGPAGEESYALEKRFAELFKNLPEVLEGRFIQISDEAGSRLLLGIRLAKESRENLRVVAERVAKAAEGALGKGRTMDITLIDGSLKEAFKKWGKVFYAKKD